MRRVAIYTRVSVDRQTTDHQERELREIAARAGWEIVEVYCDHGISGSKGRDERPAFDRLLKDATRRRFDMVAAWSVDRLGRSLQHLLVFLEELRGAGVDLFLHQQGLDTTTPAGRAMYQMLGVFAEFEKSMIVARVHAGLATARAKGTTLGRPKLADRKTQAIRAALQAGGSVRQVATSCRASVGAVHRVKVAVAAESGAAAA